MREDVLVVGFEVTIEEEVSLDRTDEAGVLPEHAVVADMADKVGR